MEKKMNKAIISFALVVMIFINVCTYCMTNDQLFCEKNKKRIMNMYKCSVLQPIDVQHIQEDVPSFHIYREEAKAKNPVYGELLQAIENQDYNTALSITEKLPDGRYKFLGASWCFFVKPMLLNNRNPLLLNNRNPLDYEVGLQKAKSLYEKTTAEVKKEETEWVSDVLYRLTIDIAKLDLENKSGSDYWPFYGDQVYYLWNAQATLSKKERNYTYLKIRFYRN
jgi:hypothetical protein